MTNARQKEFRLSAIFRRLEHEITRLSDPNSYGRAVRIVIAEVSSCQARRRVYRYFVQEWNYWLCGLCGSSGKTVKENQKQCVSQMAQPPLDDLLAHNLPPFP